MSVTRTEHGTAIDYVDFNPGDASITLPLITVAAGATLIVFFARSKSALGPQTIKWGTSVMTLARQRGTNEGYLGIAYLDNAPGGTANVVVTWSTVPLAIYTMGIMAVSITPTANPSFDRGRTNFGGSTFANTGNLLLATTQKNEYLQGAVIRWGANAENEAPGTWLDGFTAGQNCGVGDGSATDFLMEEGYKQITEFANPAAQLTLPTSRFWIAIITTFIDAFQGHVPSVTGVTSYDYRLINREELHGGGPLPEVARSRWSRRLNH